MEMDPIRIHYASVVDRASTRRPVRLLPVPVCQQPEVAEHPQAGARPVSFTPPVSGEPAASSRSCARRNARRLPSRRPPQDARAPSPAKSAIISTHRAGPCARMGAASEGSPGEADPFAAVSGRGLLVCRGDAGESRHLGRGPSGRRGHACRAANGAGRETGSSEVSGQAGDEAEGACRGQPAAATIGGGTSLYHGDEAGNAPLLDDRVHPRGLPEGSRRALHRVRGREDTPRRRQRCDTAGRPQAWPSHRRFQAPGPWRARYRMRVADHFHAPTAGSPAMECPTGVPAVAAPPAVRGRPRRRSPRTADDPRGSSA